MVTDDHTTVPEFAALLRLDRKGFVVVGAGIGMGRQSSHALAQLGARIVCVDIDGDRAKEIADEVGGVAVTADARERSDVERVMEIAQSALGQIDGIVDVVGMARWGGVLDTPEEDWDWTLSTVLNHAWHIVQLGGRAMSAHGGSMVFVSSIGGIDSAPMNASYGVAKAGMLNLVRTASVELGPLGIRVNAVCPGPTRTPRVYGGSLYIPLGEANETWDIAATILFLSSPLARHVSGQALAVDGAATQTVYDIDRVMETHS